MADTEPRYGFRYDPMEWVNGSRSLEAAKVRRLVFGREIEGDPELLAQEIDKLLADEKIQEELSEPLDHDSLEHVTWWIRVLIELGCDPDHPEVKRGENAVRRALDGPDAQALDPRKIRADPLRTFALLGLNDHPYAKASWRAFRERVAASVADWRRGNMPWPWGFAFQVGALWTGRDLDGIEEVVVDALEWTAANAWRVDAEGFSGMAAGGAADLALLASGVGHPIAGDIARQIIPFILRAQRSNGTWRDELNMIIYLMLHRHGLLEPLRQLPPLPPDWQVVRSIPAPGPNPFNIVWDRHKIWVHDWADDTATAVSPTDGTVLNTVKLPKGGEGGAFGAWDDSLWVLPSHTKTLSRIDPASGEVQDELSIDFPVTVFAAMVKARSKILISDQDGGVWKLTADGTAEPPDSESEVKLACGMPDFMAAQGEQVWCWDCVWFQGLMKCNLDGHVLDWGELPFGPDHHGIAWDGKELWALDKKNKRICIIERIKPGQN